MNPELLARNIIEILEGICWYPERAESDIEIGANSDRRVKIVFTPYPGDFHLCMGKGCCVIRGLQHVAMEIGRHINCPTTIRLLQRHDGIAEKEEHKFEQRPQFDPGNILRITSGLLASALNREVKLTHRRSNDRLEIKTVAQGVEAGVVDALGESLYAYGYRQGCIIKLSATR